MADKKKKIISTKDTIPRRPVILKSDRDTSKDQIKEKQEKEKQPTIILKTREQSTPKEERPISPKSQLDADGIYPSKIAQNENKEKKDQKCPVKEMSQAVKLLDENLEFNSAALEYLNDSNNSYLVVGIMGTQSVGKSMILNLIAQNTQFDDICHRILHSHEVASNQSQESNEMSVENQLENISLTDPQDVKEEDKSTFKFKMQDIECIEKCVHCTKGIDMYITNERIILLDCQPLWSSSLIEETSTNAVSARSANIMTVDCLQIASYLMSVCHVLIAVQDWFTDYNFIRYIQAAEMLKPSLSATNNVNTNQEVETGSGESHPHLLLLHNRCNLEDFTPESVMAMQNFYKKAFQRSNLQLNSGMYMYSDTNKNDINIDHVSKIYNMANCGSPINLFLLPEIYSDYDKPDIYRGHPSFEQLAKRLKWMVTGVNRHQITNLANLSEKGWFQFCSKAWETIRKCTFFMEYEQFLPL